VTLADVLARLFPLAAPDAAAAPAEPR
jgi:hypothetical protein